MTSDSVASFLDLARDQGLLPREQVEDLFRQPDMPLSDLLALCDFLEKRGVLTPYQAGMIRNGQGQELTFAGYPILGEIGPCPGGTAFKAAHPSLRTPLVVRRLRADWLAPTDNVSAYIQRAQTAAPVVHPNLAHLLDAGVSRDEAFVVLEPFEGSNLEKLIADIGPMPAVLAADYARQVSLGLEAAHARGIVHGGVCPANILVGPIVATSRMREDGTPRMRPAPAATVKLMELGLVPQRAAHGEYAPPERAGSSEFTAAGDTFMLGATLYYLLTGKSPSAAAPLASLRPDLPAGFAPLVAEMLARNPGERPSIRHCVAAFQALSKGQAPPARNGDSGEVKLTALAAGDVELVHAEAAPMELIPAEHEPAPAEFANFDDHAPMAQPFAPAGAGWGQPAPADFIPSALDASAYAAAPAAPTNKPAEPKPAPAPKRSNRQLLYMWLGAGLVLQLAALVIWYFVFKGAAEPEPEPYTPPATKKATPKPKPNKPQSGS
jgi:hypothetical protein